ncbi:MAG: restriction endonuclease subunit S, partial [Clostridiales bacterium]|nr:restriction endonuclease subunit S [Candidatus Cacconaster stercorequi]
NAMELQIPDEATLASFEELVAPMYRAMQENRVQSEKLAAARDALLPRLMTGELDVSNVEI